MADFNIFKGKIIEAEGGYQDIPGDTGNYNSNGQLVGTNHGISAPVYEDYLGHPPSAAEMQAMPVETAFEIYEANYWNVLKCSSINSQSLAEIICDHGINAGTSRAAKIIQTICNIYGSVLIVDGAIGTKSLAEINRYNANSLYNSYKDARIYYYDYLCVYTVPADWSALFKSWGVGQSVNNRQFHTGWINRVNSFPDLPVGPSQINIAASNPSAINAAAKKKSFQKRPSLRG